jgi:hypothetical protein
VTPSDIPALTVFNLLARYFWAFIIVSQAALARREWKSISERHFHEPDRILRYRGLFRGFLFWANLPWALMGFLILSGKVEDTFSFVRPESIDRWVFMWLVSLILILILGSFWIFLRKGAETLAAHPGVPYAPHLPAGQIMLTWILLCLLILGGIFIRLARNLPSTDEIRHYLVYFAPLPFICFWILIVWIVGKTGGWNKLADRYAVRGKFHGRLLSASGQLGMANYGGILRLGADKNGFYLGVIFMFRAAHPPLYIPWEDIRAEERKSFLMTQVHLHFAKVPDIVLRISKGTALKLKERAGVKKALYQIEA